MVEKSEALFNKMTYILTSGRIYVEKATPFQLIVSPAGEGATPRGAPLRRGRTRMLRSRILVNPGSFTVTFTPPCS